MDAMIPDFPLTPRSAPIPHWWATRRTQEADGGRVQAIHDKHPLRFRIECDGALNVGDDICFRAGGPARRRNHVPSCHLNVRGQRLGAMTHVFKFYSFHASWLHGAGRMGTFKRLTTHVLIRADEVPPWLSQWLRLLIHGTDGLYGLVKVLRVLCPFMIEPVR
jgi:hypothetical protein